MRIKHHITMSIDRRRSKAFSDAGVDLESHAFGVGEHASFDIFEDDPRWLLVSDADKKTRAIDVTTTEFTVHEVLCADFCTLLARWEHGYPQPEDTFEETTYDLSAYCSTCGSGKRQVRPFQMSSEPNWGRRTLLQLFWVPDAYFTTPITWKQVLEPLGIGCRAVLRKGGREELKGVVQIDIPSVWPLDLPPGYRKRLVALVAVPVTRSLIGVGASLDRFARRNFRYSGQSNYLEMAV